ncbi:hypothetical protein [Moorena producens]|uniref:hypothetical protein n=1 Tax=Moorena producens TaxID=1155739 RepID=UPI0011EA69FD|nr:hypothetical protein [Moorena producens]
MTLIECGIKGGETVCGFLFCVKFPDRQEKLTRITEYLLLLAFDCEHTLKGKRQEARGKRGKKAGILLSNKKRPYRFTSQIQTLYIFSCSLLTTPYSLKK